MGILCRLGQRRRHQRRWSSGGPWAWRLALRTKSEAANYSWLPGHGAEESVRAPAGRPRWRPTDEAAAEPQGLGSRVYTSHSDAWSLGEVTWRPPDEERAAQGPGAKGRRPLLAAAAAAAPAGAAVAGRPAPGRQGEPSSQAPRAAAHQGDRVREAEPAATGPCREADQWTASLKWQDDFTGQGHEPLKGKHLNDLIIERQSGGEILELVGEYMLEFSVVNAVTALHRLAKAEDGWHWRKDPRIGYLNRRIASMFASAKRDEVERLETGRRVPGSNWVYYVDTRSLCNAAWAFAQLHLQHNAMMEAVSEETCKKIFDCSPQQLAMCAWSHAKMMRVDLQLMQTLAEEAAGRIQDFNAQHLMNIVWACAKLGFLHVDLLMAIAGVATQRLEDFTPQHLSITAWAFATLSLRHPLLMDAIAKEVMNTIRAFRPQNIANTAWAYATLELRHQPLLNCLAEAAIPKLAEHSPQNLCNLVWSFATLRLPHEALFSAVTSEVIRRVGEFNPQGLSMMASTFSSMGVLGWPFCNELAEAAVRSIAEFNARDLESIAYAFAAADVEAPRLFRAIVAQVLRKVRDFNSLDLANVAWALAKAGQENEPMFIAVADRAAILIAEGSCPSEALTKLAWALSAAGATGKEEIERALAAVSHEVERKLERQDLQHLVFLLELGLPCGPAVAGQLGSLIYHLVRALPDTEQGWWSERYENLVVGLKVEHLGEYGTRLFLARLGIAEAPADWARVAAECACRGAALLEYRLQGEAPHIPGSAPGAALTEDAKSLCLRGTLHREHGGTPPGGLAPSWLRPVRLLKAGSYVDRALRGEFQALEAVLSLAWGPPPPATGAAANHATTRAAAWPLRGSVRLFTTGCPCVSCMGALAQFQQLLPAVKLEVIVRIGR